MTAKKRATRKKNKKKAVKKHSRTSSKKKTSKRTVKDTGSDLCAFDKLLNNMSEGVVVYEARDDGADFVFKNINKAGEKISKIKKREIIGKSLLKTFPSVKKIGLLAVLKKVWKTGRSMNHPAVIYKDKRLNQWVCNQIFKISSGDIIAVYSDITSRKESEKNYQNVVNNTHDVIYSLDKSGKVTFVTPNIKRYGYSEDDIIGKHLVKFIHPGDLPKMLKDVAKTMLVGDVFPSRFRMRKKDGSFVDVEELGTPIKENGKIVGITGIIRDITEQKRVDERFKLAAKASADLIYEWDIKAGTLNWYGDIDGALGYKKGTVKHTLKYWLSLIHLDDKKKLAEEAKIRLKSTKPIDKEYRLKKRDGSWSYWIDKGHPVLDEKNKPIRWIGACTDITKQKKAEEDLKSSQEKYQDLYDNSPAMFVSVDHKTGNVLECNNTLVKKTGYSRKEIIGNHIIERYHTKDAAMKAFRQFKKTGVVRDAELQLKKKSGGILDVLLNVTTVYGKNNKPLYSRSVWIDITEKKEAEEELHFKNFVFEGSLSATSVSGLDGKLTYVNPAFVKMWGYNKKKGCIGRPIISFLKYSKEFEGIMRSLTKIGRWSGEYTAVKKDGSVFLAKALATTVKNTKGKIIGYQSAVEDVTDKKKAEQALKESERQFKRLYEMSMSLGGDIKHILDVICEQVHETFGGFFVLVNHAKAGEFHFRGGCRLPKDVVDLGKEPIKGAICSHVLETKRPLFNNDLTKARCPRCGIHYRKDAAVGAFGLNTYFGSPLIFSDGRVHGTLCIVYKEKKAPFSEKDTKVLALFARRIAIELEREEHSIALRKSEEWLRLITDNTSDMISMTDPKGNYVYVSPSHRQLGYEPEDLMGKNAWKTIHPADWKRFVPLMKKYIPLILKDPQSFMKKNISETLTYRFPDKSGSWYDVEAVANIVTDSAGKIRMLFISRDITNRKKAEEALQESEEKYRTLVDTANSAIIVLRDKKIIYANKMTSNIIGFSMKELINKPFIHLIHPDDRKRVVGYHIKRILGMKVPDSYRFKAVTKKGRTIYIDVRAKKLMWEGKPAALTFMTDITEQVDAEEGIKDSEEKYRTLTENLLEGVVIVDKFGKVLFANRSALDIAGIDSVEEVLGKSVLPFVKGVSKAQVLKDLLQVFASKGIVRRTYTLNRHDKKDIIVEAVGRRIKYQGGSANLVTLRDITEKTEAEKALAQSEERYRQIFDTSPEAIILLDTKGTLVDVNERLYDWLGYKPDEIKGLNIIKLPYMTTKSKLIAMKNFVARLAGKKIPPYDLDFVHKDGRKIVGRLTATLIKDKDGHILNDLVMIADVSERRKAESVRDQSLSLLASTMQSTADGILVVDLEGKTSFSNERFREMWKITSKFMEKKDDKELLAFVRAQLYNPKDFLAKVKYLYKHPKEESHDFLHFKDGRIFERYSQPQKVRKEIVGRVWSFRDVTEKQHATDAIKESEEKLSLIFESAEDGIIFLDKTGKVIAINRVLEEKTGYKRADLIGKRLSAMTMFTPKSIGKMVGAFTQRILGKEVPPYEIEGKTVEGKTLIGEVHSSAIIKDGKIVGVVGIVRDITLRKEAERLLAQAQKRYQALYESSGDAIMTLEPPTWRFTSGNEATVKMFNTGTEKKFISLGPWDISPEYQPDGRLSADKAKKMILKAMKEGKNMFEWTHKRLKGEEFPATVLLSRVDLGDRSYLQATVRDISEQKKAEDDLKRRTAELERFNKFAVGRELRMMELKKKIKRLKQEFGG